ncbi:MAG: autotransporter-associated beta strand repeat-containing protein [Tepidisphaeraceae bacterium]
MNDKCLSPLQFAMGIGLILISAGSASAQFTDKVTTTPVLIQDGFGPAGDNLPYGGQEYCSPTAASISLGYLGVNGFNQIAPTKPTTADELNLDRIMGGLMSTSATTGTAYVSNITSAIDTYLDAKGISPSNYALTTLSSPTMSQLTNLDQPGTVVDFICGYYDPSGSSYVRNGGHCVALLDQGVTAGGQIFPSTLVINNPCPGAFEPSADLASDSLQSLSTVPTTPSLSAFGSLMLDPNQFPGFWGTTRAVVETAIALTVNPSEESAKSPALATWTWNAPQTLNPSGGSLTVSAPIRSSGSYGLVLASPGAVELENTDASTGVNTVTAGTLSSDIDAGTPFGSGAISLSAGTLQLSPASGSSNVILSAANSSGSQLTYSSGCVLALNRDGNNSLAFEIGGNTNGSTANLLRTGNGTLVIAPAGGAADLGSSEQFIVNGSGGNLPSVTHGIVSPSIVAQNSDANSSGDFLTYGKSGFAKAAYTQASVTPITSTTASTVFDAQIPQTVPANTTASVYAIKVGPVTIGGGSSSTLNVGPQSAGQAGVILNGGAISTTNLNFASAEGLIYASAAGGTINSIIKGSGGLTTFGPGPLTLTGANTFTGATHINSGTLVAANTSGSVTGTGPVLVAQNATLQINAPSAAAGGSGGTTVSSGATVLLDGGTLKGPSTFNAGSFLFGDGTIAGTTTVSATIGGSATDFAANPFNGVEDIAFTGPVTMNSSTIYDWRLSALDSAPADAGSDWSLLDFTSNSTVNMGTSSSPINVTLDLGPSVPDADSGNPFWSTSHQWDAAYDPDGFNNLWYNWNFPTYARGYFSLSYSPSVENLYVDYTANTTATIPVPEPAAMSIFALAALLMPRPRRPGIPRA